MQEKSSLESRAAFARLNAYRVSQALTWKEMARRLGTSVSMLMLVKRNRRQLSPKVLQRLVEIEGKETSSAAEQAPKVALEHTDKDSRSDDSEVFVRLNRYRISQGVTWKEVAQQLGVGVSMLMMVKRGERRLSPKVLYKLEKIEASAAEITWVSQLAVDGVLADKKEELNTGAPTPDAETPLELPPQDEGLAATGLLSDPLSLCRPAESTCLKLRRLFRETMDTRVILLACIPEQLRTEEVVTRLDPETRIRLTNAALNLVIPDWREIVANIGSSPEGL